MRNVMREQSVAVPDRINKSWCDDRSQTAGGRSWGQVLVEQTTCCVFKKKKQKIHTHTRTHTHKHIDIDIRVAQYLENMLNVAMAI